MPLTVTGFDGRGPTLKGHCWHWYCVAGDDDSAPDFSQLSLTDTYAKLSLSAVDGSIVVSVQDSRVNVGFECGGLTSLICGYLRAEANNQINARIGTLMTLPAVEKSIKAATDGLAKSAHDAKKIGKITNVVINSDGSITISGEPDVSSLKN